MTTEIIVEKADREAAEDYGLAIACRSMTFVEALARHRLAERDRVVAWLREKAEGAESPFGLVNEYCARWAVRHAAEDIERGDHHPRQEEG